MRKTLLVIGPVAVLAVLTIGLWVLLSRDSGGGTRTEGVRENTANHATDEGVTRTGTVLRTSNRDALEVCVDFIGVSDDSQIAEVALANVSSSVSAAHNLLASGGAVPESEPVVDLGCPGLPAGMSAPNVDIPGRHLLHVFVIRDGGTASLIGTRIQPYASQEFMCDDGVCAEVTAGIYLEESDARDPETVTNLINYALGVGGSDPDSGRGTSAEGVRYTGDVLSASNRDTFAICAEFVDPPPTEVSGEGILSNLETALSKALSDPMLLRDGSQVPGEVEQGCPAHIDDAPRRVEAPSDYSLFVYIVSDRTAEAFVQDNRVPFFTREVLCGSVPEGGLQDATCVEVTSGMYVGMTDATDAERLEFLLRFGLGLEGPTDALPD